MTDNPNISLSDPDVDEIESVLPDGAREVHEIAPNEGLLIEWVAIPVIKLITSCINWLNRQLMKLK